MRETIRRCSNFAKTSSSDPEPNFKYKSHRQQHLGGLSDIILERVSLGWLAYLLTIEFRQLPGSPKAVMEQMLKQTEGFYRKLVTRFHRCPTSKQAIPNLPVLLASADLPVPKHAKRKIADVTINGGLHVHGVLVIPPLSRLRIELGVHLMMDDDRYRHGSQMSAIFAKPIEHSPANAAPYVFKQFDRGQLDYDNSTLFLPRVRSEII